MPVAGQLIKIKIRSGIKTQNATLGKGWHGTCGGKNYSETQWSPLKKPAGMWTEADRACKTSKKDSAISFIKGSQGN